MAGYTDTATPPESLAPTTATSLPRPSLHRPGRLRELLELAVFVIAVYALVELAIPRFMVDGRSMQPTFHDGERLIVSRINYLFGTPQRGDIIVFNSPSNPRGEPLIKRVIGTPGDTVEFRDAQVYLNGQLLDEPYINEPCRPNMCQDAIYELGADEYFVMGDNRNHSNDSRRFGPVPFDNIIGDVLIRYWPPSDWGIVSRIGYPGE